LRRPSRVGDDAAFCPTEETVISRIMIVAEFELQANVRVPDQTNHSEKVVSSRVTRSFQRTDSVSDTARHAAVIQPVVVA
jgi:hypothetical protein